MSLATKPRRSSVDPTLVIERAGSELPEPKMPGLAIGLLAAFALESFVFLPDGDVTLAVQLARSAAILAGAAGTWFLWRRSHDGRARALLEIAVAVTALLGGGVATLARSGDLPLAHSVLAVPVVVGGIVLLAGATWRLLRTVRSGWRRVVAVPLGILPFLYLVTPVAMGVLATNRARTTLGSRTPADVGLAYEAVSLEAPGGVRLAGWYVPSRNGAAVLALAGSGSTRDDLLDHAAFLARHGYGVLLVDVPGHGGSAGEPMEFGWGAESYLDVALDELERRPDVRGPIGVLGLSMGGEEALTLAAVDARVRAVVTEGASGRTWNDAWNRPDPIAGRAVMLPFNWLTTATTDLLADASPPMPLVDAVRRLGRRPVLFISAGTGMEREANRVLVDAAANAERWELPGAAHTGGLASHPLAYERRVLAFLDRALLGSPAASAV